MAVTDRYSDAHNGVTHVYLRQRYSGIEVFDANVNISVARDGSIIYLAAASSATSLPRCRARHLS